MGTLNWIHKLCHYWKRNFAIRLSFISVVTFILGAIVFQWYLQANYLDYLIDTTAQDDEIILSIEDEAIENNLKSVMELTAKTSVDTDLIKAADNLSADRKDISAKLTLKNQFDDLLRSNGKLCNAAIIDENDTVLYQKNPSIYGQSSETAFWNENNREELTSLVQQLRHQLDLDTVPRMAMSTLPNNVEYLSNNVSLGAADHLYNLAVGLPGNQRSGESLTNILVLSFQLSSIEDFFNQIGSLHTDYTWAYITDSEDKVIYAPDRADLGKNLSEIAGGRNSKVISRNTERNGWKISIVLDINGIRRQVRGKYTAAFLIFLIVILVICILQIVVTQSALRPVRTIRHAMNELEEGILAARINVHGEDEIGRLARSYNEMADALDEWKAKNARQNEEKLEQVRKTADAQMHALQSQINAHFLCNTLNAINMSAIEQGNDEVSEMLRKLSNIMRYAYSREYQFVTLRDEVQWVSEYLALQKFRLMDVFDYRIDFPESYLEWPCLKLFLQPFVENSIKHGFEAKETGCVLILTGEMEGDRMKITIEDNGSGMTEERRKTVEAEIKGDVSMSMEGVGIGLENVAARLRIYYGEHLDIHLWSEEGKGTRWTLYLPIPETLMAMEDGGEL